MVKLFSSVRFILLLLLIVSGITIGTTSGADAVGGEGEG